MGILERVSTVLRRGSRSSGNDEDLHARLDRLGDVRRALAEVTSTRRRLEHQLTALEQRSDSLHDQARRALSIGREDLAREAITRRSGLHRHQVEVRRQPAALQAEEERLTVAAQRLQARVEAAFARAEGRRATGPVGARTSRDPAAPGGSGEPEGVEVAGERAEGPLVRARAVAGEIEELLGSGALEEPTGGGGGGDLAAELDRAASSAQVERELARLRAEVAPHEERP